MRLKIAPTSLQSSPQSFTSPKPTSIIDSPSSTKCTKRDGALVRRFVCSSICTSMKIQKSRSFNKPVSRGHTLKRACSTNSNEYLDDELCKNIEGLAQKFDISDDENEGHKNNSTICTASQTSFSTYRTSFLPSKLQFLAPPVLGIWREPPEWPEGEEFTRASIEWKANSMDLPLSIRMIKKKQQCREGFRDLGESSCCSVNAAFSSMVFVILELQSYALRMREVLSYEDLEGITARVQREMHTTFAWLFQQVFSRTPSLMIYVMILLANFSVHSLAMANNVAVQDRPLLGALCETTETVSVTERQNQQPSQADMVPGNNGGGVRVRPIAYVTGGGDRYLDGSSLSIQSPSCVPDHISRSYSNEDYKLEGKEAWLWKSTVDEAMRMRAELGGGVLDHETMQQLVSPVSVELEPDTYVDYFRTDLVYQMALSQEPNNPLLLCNYAQFLFLVAHDYDRAEECFKRAIQVEPLDAEPLSHYANFLWIVRDDLWEAEERYQQAMAAEQGNPYHASKYANFLWSTGGEETCLPSNTFLYNKIRAQNF
ncbi:hypothetical protein F0562_026316 [Nyssa sinensis]|uniref:Uncharacterized protein n=1 Tax=Nyssa sinensis TaxID=561372 RepID=A0A5J5BAE6_9ASTE|nr:hypothetical protein F0562_026316 [Nyssa sinensis]